MRSKSSTLITGTLLLPLLAIPLHLSAQDAQPSPPDRFPHYKLTDLGTLGGPVSQSFGINNKGHVGGQSITADGVFHAFLWTKEGGMQDIGTLGGPNSGAGLPNEKDLLPLISDTTTPDPYGEDFCGFGTHLICASGVWKHGVLTTLPSLSGNNTQVTGANNFGQVVGWSEVNTYDASCDSATPGQALDFEAVIWDARGKIHALPPLDGDTVSFALGINGRGEAAGASGLCGNTPMVPIALGPHAVLWRKGSPIDLGNLGSPASNTATAVNDESEVTGVSSLSDGVTVHAFRWTERQGITDLGTIGDDVTSLPGPIHSINNQGQIVGASCPTANYIGDLFSGTCRAFVWSHNAMKDLNALISAEDNPEGLHLFVGYGINDEGAITGWSLTSTGELHAFLATPMSRGSEDDGRY